ncbi:hypothetical protein BUALT_Bualt09G0139300 [Buddleja alternifolia]|uniref:RING-type E3 ubiquitin transferase n=1 Tax=Buddleja alternifolia TaxID=168488 RepID=A0AAV6X927_9LAMI|nr:hypothetical protein BUALT_Bualt09G0139300 [Buddleja alternifolia]
MDVNSGNNNNNNNVGESSTIGYICESSAVSNYSSSLHSLSTTCALCHRFLSSDNNETGDLEAISICGDCKFLLMEDLDTDASSPDVYQRRTYVSRRRHDGSSESIDSMFSQQLSHMITLARQNERSILDHDNQSAEGAAARLVQRTSSRTTPSGSRRWRRVFSDTESDGIDSLYGETESNTSFRRYRLFHGEADTISAYGGDSDASIDGQSFLENENFIHPDGASDLESDTDIDPMNAGLYQWNSEDQEEDEDDSEWEEADTQRDTVESLRAGAHLRGSLRSNGSIVYINRQVLSPEVDDTFQVRIRGRIQAHTSDLFTNFQESEAQNYVGDSGNYLDAIGLDNLLEHLAETESSRRGAPPASVSFVNNMPCKTINEDDEKLDSLACAVCKESLSVGIVVNQLPCFHLYHPSCILPWLSARNTCPLCRYELPTDDKDYEERKRSRINAYQTLHIHQNDDSSLDDTVADEHSQLHNGREPRELADADSFGARDIPTSRWFLLAAPIVTERIAKGGGGRFCNLFANDDRGGGEISGPRSTLMGLLKLGVLSEDSTVFTVARFGSNKYQFVILSSLPAEPISWNDHFIIAESGEGHGIVC